LTAKASSKSPSNDKTSTSSTTSAPANEVDEDSDEESDSDSAASEASSISLDLDSGNEDWSEGSTDMEDLGFPSEDVQQSDTESESLSSEVNSSSSSNSSETDDEHPSSRPGFMIAYESDSGKDIGFDDEDDNDNVAYNSGSDGPAFKRLTISTTPKGMMSIFDISQETPRQVFQYLHPLPIMLYESPPAIHPTKPLVVWPLCGGDIMFADFLAKSYFIRKSRPTSAHSMPSKRTFFPRN
jgi:hypothetical protein